MNMTHYMELLATNQPWNLLHYMVVPVVLAEALVAVEFFIVFYRKTSGPLKTTSKILSIVAGAYFTFAIFFPLLFTAIPTMKWRTGVDFIAVWSYLLGVVPLAGLALLELGWIGKNKTPDEQMKLHFLLLTVFLIVAHVAMIFGMVNPEILGNAAGGSM
ncbi:hypothetical protein EDC14_102821 [Hydrogenispora ethanolica]|jgi:hypothetical protein|uniref:Permease n=1 Tax=Hydrogenispora ethanolica TaxID=1082276 RepID=A0A4R1R8R6_HYDET|nr:DUF6803 family protein [Hydrogenispora ethanolica]TCL62065.1 hypothetical protein EDC14_102821 [Hydrogenispora ethanolica]